jgi:hypothetical protein
MGDVFEEEVVAEVDQACIEHRDQPRNDGSDPEHPVMKPKLMDVLEGPPVGADAILHGGQVCAKG